MSAALPNRTLVGLAVALAWCLAGGLAAREPAGAALPAAASAAGSADPGTAVAVKNAGFEQALPGGYPRDWEFGSWTEDAQASVAALDSSTRRVGGSSLRLSNRLADDSHVTQRLVVAPESWYRFRVWVKAEGIAAGQAGANLSVLGSVRASADLVGSRDWTELVAYGRTGPGQDRLDLSLRLGNYGHAIAGQAWFDDLRVDKAAPPPAGALVFDLSPPAQPSAEAPAAAAPASPKGGGLALAALCLAAMGLYVLVAYLLALRQSALPALAETGGGRHMAMAGLAALAVKLGLAACCPGYPADLSAFGAWAGELARVGPADLYRPDFFLDYPPAYLYALWPIGALLNAAQLSPGSPAYLALLKLPAILADLASAYLLYRMAKRHAPDSRWLRHGLPLLWLANPLSLADSSVWGQVDAVFALCLLAAFWLLETERLEFALPVWILAVLLKPQALLAAPVALLWLLRRRPFPVRRLLLGLAFGAGLAVALVLPFAVKQEPFWIFRLYAGTLGSYDYATLNAANLWFLLGLNWTANDGVLPGISLNAVGWAAVGAAAAFVAYCLARGPAAAAGRPAAGKAARAPAKRRARAPADASAAPTTSGSAPPQGAWLLAGFALYVVFFALATKMHERYLFPAPLLGFGAYVFLRDRRVLWAALAAMALCFFDLADTLWTMLVDNSSGVDRGDPLMVLSALGSLALAGYALYLCHAVVRRGRGAAAGAATEASARRKPQATASASLAPAIEPVDAPWRLRAALAVLTGAYALAALFNLGSDRSPQSFWEPAGPGQAATFRWDAAQDIARLDYHIGLGSGEFRLEYSDDGTAWRTGAAIKNDNRFAEFRWRSLPERQSARYLRIGLASGRQQLNEIAFFDGAGRRLPPPRLADAPEAPGAEGAAGSGAGLAEAPAGPADPGRLFDEQSTTVAWSDSFNGMYFDEVYFARSAWEILQGRNASENTHPPLGKIILAGSVACLGMNPLAWRLPGTLAGIAMLPLMYLLARRLFGSARWGFFAAWLLAVDFMHFTQTRIGTVDSLVMLFVLAAWYFLLRWRQDAGAAGKGAWPAWANLPLSGLAIGLGMATKWTAVYAAAGLAVLFFDSFFRQGREWLRRDGLATLGHCAYSFVAIPALVYVLAYVPLMSVTGSGLAGLVENQSSMWNYHANLRETHPYSSEWWTWPLMLKPIWFYGGQPTPAGWASTIENFGNPIVWYGGSAALLAILAFLALGLHRRLRERLWTPDELRVGLFVAVSALAQYLPWALIPRKLVFIYHFFLTTPFLVLALALALRMGLRSGRLHRSLPWIAGGAASLLFVLFLPVIGGGLAPRAYLELLKTVFFWIPIYF